MKACSLNDFFWYELCDLFKNQATFFSRIVLLLQRSTVDLVRLDQHTVPVPVVANFRSVACDSRRRGIIISARVIGGGGGMARGRAAMGYRMLAVN